MKLIAESHEGQFTVETFEYQSILFKRQLYYTNIKVQIAESGEEFVLSRYTSCNLVYARIAHAKAMYDLTLNQDYWQKLRKMFADAYAETFKGTMEKSSA